jgi:hypothetical protein
MFRPVETQLPVGSRAMAKSQIRSGREPKKPKKVKPKIVPVAQVSATTVADIVKKK